MSLVGKLKLYVKFQVYNKYLHYLGLKFYIYNQQAYDTVSWTLGLSSSRDYVAVSIT